MAEWVPGPSGPARRQYTITPAGREHLARDRTALGALTAALGAEPPGDRSPRAAAAPEIRAALSHVTPTHDAAIMAEGATGDL
ncbi:PadR family transcriptional regulator [Brachybacterium sp. Z12]|uniref:PadR family transcriptional regulator n=1 Tax=Brachybacterium sp. Z12 TaxID=2759167 RepID=UPI00223B6C0F|nr:PadR family transcriptional regulator [Brachybacterium sp. Z12]